MDFSAWFEAYLEGGWYTFDARHNVPRIGRVLIARGRDATREHERGIERRDVDVKDGPRDAALEHRRVAATYGS